MLKFTGKFAGFNRDYLTGKNTIAFEVNEDITPYIDAVKDADKIAVDVRKWRRKRSLSANAYFHALNDKLAKTLCMSATRCKNALIARYGQPLYIGETPAVIKSNIEPALMLEQEHLHVAVVRGGDSDTTFYKVFRPTHEYNSAEMAQLIRGTVEECELQGIQTITNAEIESLCKQWNTAKSANE